MPDKLDMLLQLCSDEDAKEIWDYLDGNPDAIFDMIEKVCSSHPAMVARYSGKKSEGK